MKIKSVPATGLMLFLGILSIIALIFLMPKSGRAQETKKEVVWKNGQGRVIMSAPVEQFDFEDGQGKVPAYRHPNGGGWVAVSAHLTKDVFIGQNARVFGNAALYGNVRIDGNARVYGDAQVFDDAIVFGDAKVFGRAQVYMNARVFGQAQVYDNAEVFVDAWVFGNSRLHGSAQTAGCYEMSTGDISSVDLKTYANECRQYQNRPDPYTLTAQEFNNYLKDRPDLRGLD